MAAPLILVPGFWLGAWAWDDVAAPLRAQGHDVTALTLPGLESVEVDRSVITLAEHVDAICTALSAAAAPSVLVVHSGASVPGYGALDRLPERVAAMVYVDTAPGTGAIRPDFTDPPCPNQGPRCARVRAWPTRPGWTCRAR
jgi:pimeloyl-ACP methyl ester carboxylesterase